MRQIFEPRNKSTSNLKKKKN